MNKFLISSLVVAGLSLSSCKVDAPKTDKAVKAVEAKSADAVKKVESKTKEVEAKKVELPAKKVEEVKSATVRHTPKTTWEVENKTVLAVEKATEKAPKTYKVKFATSQGDIVFQINRTWAPNGADRFYNLVKIGFFDDIAMFRAIPGFMIQFGIHGNPAVSAKWKEAKINDDPANKDASNTPGMLTFATAGKDTRTTQLFINLGNNARLDAQGFTPFGKVVEGMDVVKKLNTEYGENSPGVQGNFQAKGNAFISKRYPNLDYIKSAEIVK